MELVPLFSSKMVQLLNNSTSVLYLSYDGLSDPLGQSQILPYLIGLSQRNYHFHVISFEKKKNFHHLKTSISEICKQNNIYWYPLLYHKKPPVLSTLWDIVQLHRKAFRIQKQYSIKIVHCRSYIASLVGLNLKKRRKTSFLFDMRGFWADERIEGKIWSYTNPVYRSIYSFFKKQEKKFFQSADAIISLTEEGKNAICEMYSFVSEKNIQVIPCTADFSKFSTVLLNEDIRKQLNLKADHFVLTYIGSLGTWYLLDEMMLFFKQLLNKYPHAIFLFLSPEPKFIIQESANRHGISKEKIRHVSIIHEQVPQYLAIADMGIVFITNLPSKKASSPTKFAELLAANLPVVCNNIGDLKIHSKRIPYTYCFDKLDANAFKEFIDNFQYPNEDERKQISQEAKKIYDLSIALSKYVEVYNRL